MTNTLDLIITEGKERVYEFSKGEILGDAESGHVSISWKYAVAPTKDRGKKMFSSERYNYKKGDYVGMSEHLGNIDLDRLLSGVGVQGQYTIFLREFEVACKGFIRRVKGDANKKIRPKWMSKEISGVLLVF